MEQLSQVMILDVGHGNATLIQENGTTVLVDSATKATLRRHVDKLKIKKIDLVVISHADYDHIGGLLGLLIDGFEISAICLNGDADKDSESWKDILQALEDAEAAAKTVIRFGVKEGKLEVDGFDKAALQIVSPSLSLIGQGAGAIDKDGRKITSNSVSVVVRILYEGIPVVLLTGDIDGIALDYIVKKGNDISAQYMVFPHHGGLPGGANAAEFTNSLLDIVKPKTVIFSHGRDKFANPNLTILRTVAAKKISIGCTQISKHCVKNVTDVPGREFHDEVYSAGREKHSSCTGTIVISLKDGTMLEKVKQSHITFVRGHVPGALCA